MNPLAHRTGAAALTRAIPELCRAGLSLSVASTAACGALLAGSLRDATVAFSAVLLLAAGVYWMSITTFYAPLPP